jgi:glycosyltransferase involved in cell wall biosynthesis
MAADYMHQQRSATPRQATALPPLAGLTHVIAAAEMGGAERVALELSALQRAQGIDVRVVSLAPLGKSALVEEFRDRHIPLEAVPKRPGFDLSLVPRLAARFRQLRTSIVHTHNPQPIIYAAPAARLVGAGVVHTKHGVNPDVGRRLWLRRRGASLSHTFVAVSEETAREAIRNKEVSLRKLRVIPNGIDPARFRPDQEAASAVRSDLGIDADAAVLGTVGRLCAVKNQSLLLRSAAPLLHAGAWLIVVGGGPDRESLETLAAELGISERIRWLGERGSVSGLLAAMNVFALSSHSEGLPLVILEAMATGLPVVATAVGGVSSVVDEGETGFLVGAGDESAMRERLQRLLSDRELASTLGRQGRARVHAEFSSNRVGREYLRLYREAGLASRGLLRRRQPRWAEASASSPLG